MITAAGAVTAMLAIGLLIRFPRTFPPHHVVSIAAAAYAAAAVGVSMMHAMGWPLVALGLVLGTTWALAYTASPMVVSELVGDRSRARYIGYVTGSIQVGFGLGPIVGSALQDLGFALETVFRVAAGLAVAAAVVAAPLHRRAPALSLRLAAVGPPGQPLGRALVTIVRSRAAIPLVMVLICACLFTTMNTFQTTFGDARSLDYDVFFASYTAAVIAARFGIVRWLSDSSSPHVLAVSTAGVGGVDRAVPRRRHEHDRLRGGVGLARAHVRAHPAGGAGPGREPQRGGRAPPAPAPRRARVRDGDPRLPRWPPAPSSPPPTTRRCSSSCSASPWRWRRSASWSGPASADRSCRRRTRP